MNHTTIIVFILIPVFAGILLSLTYWTLTLGISPTPTSPKVKKTLSALLPESVNGNIHELGSGWGNLLSTLNLHYPNHAVLGHERSPIPRWCSMLTSRVLKTSVTITGNDIFTADLSHAGLVICYLYPGAMRKLSKHLDQQLPENCWIISHTFHLPGWEPVQTIKSNDLYKTPVYLYRKTPENCLNRA